jgi:hypothetical protein
MLKSCGTRSAKVKGRGEPTKLLLSSIEDINMDIWVEIFCLALSKVPGRLVFGMGVPPSVANQILDLCSKFATLTLLINTFR